MLEAQCVSPARHRERSCDPGVVAQRLVVEPGALNGGAVALGVRPLAVEQPVAQPPRRRARHARELATEAKPVLERHALTRLQRGRRGACGPTPHRARPRQLARAIAAHLLLTASRPAVSEGPRSAAHARRDAWPGAVWHHGLERAAGPMARRTTVVLEVKDMFEVR